MLRRHLSARGRSACQPRRLCCWRPAGRWLHHDPRLVWRPALCPGSAAHSTSHRSQDQHSYRLRWLASHVWPSLHGAAAVVTTILAAAPETPRLCGRHWRQPQMKVAIREIFICGLRLAPADLQTATLRAEPKCAQLPSGVASKLPRMPSASHPLDLATAAPYLTAARLQLRGTVVRSQR